MQKSDAKSKKNDRIIRLQFFKSRGIMEKNEKIKNRSTTQRMCSGGVMV